MATTIARQIKVDFPGCHLTWAIGYKCRHVIENNPDVDTIWSVEYARNELPHADVWWKTKAEAERRRAAGEFDRVFYTQIYPENFNNFDGTTRTSIFRAYPGRITVPVAPVIRLYDHEVERVRAFVDAHRLTGYRNVIIFESAPASGQSPITPELAMDVARRVVQRRSDTVVILSSHLRFEADHPALIDGSVLSYRENAELSKYATLLLGGSSGLTWLLTSEWAKRLPTIQFLQQGYAWYSFASVAYDHRFFGLKTDHILETDLNRSEDIAVLVARYLDQRSFDGLPGHRFTPSVDQIHGLYEMTDGRLEVVRALSNFVGRNPGVPIALPGFFRRLATQALRRETRRVLRRVKRAALDRLRAVR
jgi:hypothetical protein